MQRMLLPLPGLIKAINDSTDPFDEWGEWFVHQHAIYLMEGEITDILSLLSSIMPAHVATVVMVEYEKEIKSISDMIVNYKEKIVDYQINQFGITIIRKDDATS